jgi:endonuclease G
LVGESITILQHALAQPLKMALMSGAILDIVSPLLHYHHMTEPGSAGGPGFNDEWELVAMHHARVPRSWKNPFAATNVGEGVLCSAIRARLANNGKLADLGGRSS